MPLKEPLVATLSETCALTSRANVAEKGMSIPNFLETLTLLWPHSSVFALGKNLLKMLDFDGFFFSKNPFVGKFHLTFSKIFKRNCRKGTKLSLVSIF